MAKFLEDKASIQRQVKPKKKKKEETVVKKAQSPSVSNKTQQTVSRLNQKYGGGSAKPQTVKKPNAGAKKATQPVTQQTRQKTVDRLSTKYGQNKVERQEPKRRFQPETTQRISKNPRMLDTASNVNPDRDPQNAANRAARNTPTIAKESLKQVAAGHGKTASDITSMNQSSNIGAKIDVKSKEFQEDIQRRRVKSTEAANKAYDEISKIQDKSEQNMQKLTKDAKGLEKAYYGALESGIGMATDQMLGPAWAVSMMSRTYGNTRGKAQQEGATENEDRANALLQGAKEVATEYLFRGVGLASKLSGAKSLSPSERIAKAATKNMTGTAANVTHAGIRLLGGTAEENIEELIGWGLDPLISEAAYKRNVRTREAQQMLKDQSDSLRSNITSEEDARSIAAYLGSDDFIESNMKTYMDSGIDEAEARELAEKMRDYLTASLTGDTEAMADIEEELSKTLSGKGLSKESWSLSELMDTVASTTLLTMTTGLPGSVSTAARGAAFLENNSNERIRALADTAIDFENKEMSAKAEAMRDRLDAGQELTSTQAYDLMQGVAQQYAKDSDRQQAAYRVADNTIRDEKLVAPFEVSRNGSLRMGEVTNKEYRSSTREAKKSITGFIKSDSSESITEEQIDRGSRAIAGFKTGVFTVDDANELNYRNTAVRDAFKAETGIDLNEYIVKGKNGEVDIPATNTATKNALFALAAENLVVSAQAETENWMDNTKGEVVSQISNRMGAQGLVDLQYVLDDVDERDRATYMMTANMADVMYQQGRNLGLEWDAVKADAKRLAPGISQEKLREMYEAGRFDRDRASDKARGQQIKVGEKVALAKDNEAPMGQVLIDTDKPVKGTVIRAFSEVAKNLGVDIHLVDHFTDKDGKVLKNVNGEYINGAIYINVNSKFEKNIGYIFMHEVTHHLKTFAPEQYNELENLVRERWFKYDAVQMQNEIAKKIDAYERNGQTLTEEQALEEIIADAAHEFINDRNFANAVAEENPSLAQAVLNSIRNALRMLRRVLATGSIDDETHMNTLFSQLDILDEAERLWLGAYTQAVKNKAAVDLNRLQERIYEEGRKSIGYHAGDLGKSTVDDYAHQGYSRGSGHFGFGTYFVGDEDQINYGDYGKRKRETVDFDKYNLFRPKDFEQGYKLHSALRTIDGIINDYSDFIKYKDSILNRDLWDDEYYKEKKVNTDIERLVDEYEMDEEPNPERKERIDKYISEMPEHYRENIEREAQKKYDEAQSREVNEDEIRERLATRYDIFGSYLYDNVDDYVNNNIESEIRYINNEKEVPYEQWYYEAAKDAIKEYSEAWSNEKNTLTRLSDELKAALGYKHTRGEIEDALLKTEEIVKGYQPEGGYRLNARPGLDSGATVFMKQLGYEGVDVRHISEMDNTGYGSVIYDLKGEDLARKQEIGTARFSISDMPSIDQLDQTNSIVEDENGDMVAQFQENGSVQFSISSFENSGRQIYEDYLKKQVANHNLSKAEADEMLRELDTIYKISKEFADKTDEDGNPVYAPYTAWSYADVVTDDKGKPVFSAIKKNSEYKMNIDFSTICKKRRTLDAVFREMINRGMFEKLDLNKDESAAMVVNINNLIRQHKFEAACALCFVEARRYRQQQTATTFRDMWNRLVESMYTGNNKAAYFNFGEDSTVEDVPNAIHTLDDSELDLTYIKKIANEKDENGKKKQTAEAKAARLLLNDPSQRKLMRVGDMMASTGFENMQIQNPELMKVYNSKKGTGGAKSSFGDVQYLNEILRPRTFGRMSAYAVSGVRIQSFSDYVPRMVFDYVQVIADLAAKRLPAHGYTKEPLFVKQFGLTGTKINMSLVPDVVPDGEAPGLDKNGNYIWNEEGTFPYDEAMAIQEAEGYKENCGTIAVGISDKHIMKMLADPKIQMVIPYHKSSLNPIVAAMTNVDRFKDYTEFQNTKDAEGKTVAKDFEWDKKLFRLSHDSKGKMLPREQWGNVQDLVKEYAEWCKKHNYTPKFADFLYMDNGSINPGYYKLLEDFALLDNDGNFKPQGDVQMRFPTESDAFGSMKDLIAQGLTEDTELEAKRSSEISGIVDEIDEMFNQGTLTEQTSTSEKLAARMSISEDLDEPYMDAVNSGDMDEAQRLVGEAAKRAGYDTPKLHHGSPSFGFTTFDLSKGEGIIFATNSRRTAETYSGETDRDRISDTSELNVDELYGEKLLDAAKKYMGRYADYRLMSGREKEDILEEDRADALATAKAVEEFISENKDSFDEEKLDLANRIVDAINRIGKAWNDDDVQNAYEDYWNATYDLMWIDESIQKEIVQVIGPSYVEILKKRISDMLYAGDLYTKGKSTYQYVFDNQLALELDASLHKGIYGLYGRNDNQLVINANGANWNDITPPEELGLYGPQRTRSIAEAAKEKGYNSVLFTDLRDNGGETPYNGESDVYMFFNSSQVKSADPVTYAEDGSVIPLSERFDPTNPDIRYSMSTTDSDGNILTDGQMDYFKNSQARNEQGRLVPVYHTTNNGGFTVFDPSYSDDKRSLFFASNWRVSQTYGRGAFDPIDLNNERFDTWGDFVAAANAAFDGYDGWDSNKSFEENTHLKLMDGTSEADISIEEWMAMPHDEQLNSDYYVEMKLPYLGNPEFDWQDYEFYDSNTMMLELNHILGKGKTVQRGYYSVYLNLENPLIVDAKGANWNRISFDPYGNETAGITVQDAIEQIESADIADYGIKNIDVEFEYNDDGFPIAVSYDIGLLGIPDEEHWEWTNYVESDSFEPNVEEYTDNGVLDNAELGIAMWTWVEDKLRNYVSDGMIDMMEQTNIDVNGELHYESFNKTGYDFIRGGNIVDVSEFTDNIDDASGKEYTVNTRDLAEIAENYGHDGVIIRNCYDIGGASSLKGRRGLSDIFIAFSSNQIKDTRNENPSENPDIRYSFTEDEVNSRKDYDYASSDDYEWLEMYEDMLSDADAETAFVNATDENFNMERFMRMLEKYGKADKRARKTGKTAHVKLDNTEDLVNAFHTSLVEESRMVYDDDMLEEGRKRMASSKQDFWNNLNTKWNNNWISEGLELNVDSVKRDVKNLVMGIMDKSDTDKKYKSDLVKKTLMDMRLAFRLMKQDRTELASAILYHSALRMIENVDFIEDDSEYQNYKALREYLRKTKISFSEEYWNDVDFQAYRKRNMGRLKIVKGENNIDKGIYSELQRQWPEYFGFEEMRKQGNDKMGVPEMMSQLDYVLNLQVDPITIAYSSEECASWAFDIADELYEIMANGDRIVSTADRYKEKYDAQARAMKTRHAEALLRIRKAKEEGIAAEKAKFKEYKEKQKEKKFHSKYFDSIAKSHKTLSERLLTNTKDKHIPEVYKAQLAELLSAFDLQTVGSKKVEARRGVPGKKTIQMAALRTTLKNMAAKSELFYLNDSITDIMDELLGINSGGGYSRSIEGLTLDELDSTELKKIDKMFKALIHEFNYYESVRVGEKRQQAEDIGTEQVNICLAHADAHGEGKDYQNFLGAMDRILNLDEVTPAYMFKMIDPESRGIGMMFKELRRSFGRYVKNQEQLNTWMEEILGEYHNKGKYGSDTIDDWRLARSAREFQLESGKTIKLTPAQMMSIYCLSNRAQAVDHMTGAGVVVQPVTYMARMETDLKRKANYALPAQLTMTDIENIKSKLTPAQIKVATKLQELMATKMAEWGNEASMSVIGIRLFEDPDYFPIKSDKAALEKDFSADQFTEAIRNFGFTKAVQPGAKNAIAVGDIFDVVAEHCNQMNLYNSYSEAMNDFMKVYNFHQYREDGSDYSVEQAIAYAYSQKATTYIGTFMKDLNGNVSRDRVTGIETMMNDMLSKAKKTSVFANGRVALQQPTAIMRAFAVIDPKYIKGVSVTNATMREMFEHSPIALWKSWGYYDINMGKSIEDLMMNNGSAIEDWMTDLYGKLDNRTWAAIWGMCKAEIEDKHKDVKAGTDEYWELVSGRFDEVIDLTQVVDSPFHRSHAMRSKGFLHKMATAFMAEPTLTFNMVRDGFIRTKEQLRLGNKANAGKIFGRTLSVFILSAATTAAAAAIWDVVRGKNPGDGDDDDKLSLWYANFLENIKDNLNLLNNIYYVKDVVSIFQGWDQRNLGLQGFKHLADGYRQLTGQKVSSSLSWWQNLAAGIGYLSGYPVKTVMNDFNKVWDGVFGLFGMESPKPFAEQLEKLDEIGGSAKDMNRGGSSALVPNSGSASSPQTSVNLWTYDNAPFRIEDGSLADSFLNHFGINLTASEIAAREKAEAEKEYRKRVDKIKNSLSEYSGDDYDKHLWDKQDLEGYGKALADGDFEKAEQIEKMFLDCGGSQKFLDDKKLYHYNKNYIKTITYDPTDAQIERQSRMRDFLLSHGVSESELSAKVYKSQTAKELKVAFRINDKDAMIEELVPLIRAGLTEEDYLKLWKNRNRLDLKAYKASDGKYADRLKSTGTYNWPINGQITSGFGHRSSPGGIGSTNHQGLDIAGSMGDPVAAADGGTVVYAGWYGGAGKTVMIEHDDGVVTQYSHLSWWDAKVGDTVAQGQTIGNVGSTGNSTGPHLHFGVKVNGSYVNPLDYLN